MICIRPPVLSRLSRMFKSPFVIELRACPRITKLLIAGPSADYPGGYLLLCGRAPWVCAIIGIVYLSGTGEPTALPNTGRLHSWTVPSAPEVIDDVLSGLHAAANYVHQPLSGQDGNA